MVEVNSALADNPAAVNESPEDTGWFLKLKVDDPAAVNDLMDADAYKAFLETI